MDLVEIADACSGLGEAWVEVGAGLAVVPATASAAGFDARQFGEFMTDGPANVGFAPGQYAGLYVDAIGQHVRALEALVRTGRVTLGPWPLTRAALELAGRVAWLLEPELGPQSGQRRVARFYMETVSSLQRERFTAGKISRSQERLAKTGRDATLAEARSVFGDFDLDFSAMDKVESWVIAGEPFKGLGAAAGLFVRLCFERSGGLYDYLSDYSHPSLTAVVRQTRRADMGGVTTRPWVVELDVVEHQARLACLIFYKACHLVGGYYSIDTSPLERWADSVPTTWFNEVLGSGTVEASTT